MDRNEDSKGLLPYRVALGVALVALAVLALRWEPIPPTAADTTPGRVTVVDLGDMLARLDHVAADKDDEDRVIFRAPRGTVSLKSLTYRQLDPLHFQRMTHEASLPVFGDLELTSFKDPLGAPGGGPPVAERPGATTLVYARPYAAQQWNNLADRHVGVLLVFRTIPTDSPSYVKPDDPRIALGPPVEELDAVAAPEGKAGVQWGPLVGKLGTLAVATEAGLESGEGATIVYAVKGRGKLMAEGEHAFGEHAIAYLPAGVSARLVSDKDAPLHVLVFQPGRADVSEILTRGKKVYSQDNEELVIRDFFHDRHDGTWLDIGAGDWQRYSTTLYLEEKLNWSGVSVDAIKSLGAGYAAHRKRTRFANYLITDKPRGVEKFYRADDFPEVSSTERKVAEDQEKTFRGNTKVTELDVPTTTIDELLGQFNVSHFDFLSMDIEEHEPEALAGFSIGKFRPELVCIEVHRSVRDAIYKYFHDNGYRRLDKYLAFDEFNWYFTPAD